MRAEMVSKYRNVPVVVAGIRFASQAEAKRHAELLLLERAGQITALQRQPRYALVVNGKTICTYVGDFYYRELLPANMPNDVRWGLSAGPMEVVEEVKGCETPTWKIKRKLFEALHPTIELRIIPAKSGRRSSGPRVLPRMASATKRNAA